MFTHPCEREQVSFACNNYLRFSDLIEGQIVDRHRYDETFFFVIHNLNNFEELVMKHGSIHETSHIYFCGPVYCLCILEIKLFKISSFGSVFALRYEVYVHFYNLSIEI